MLLAKTDVVDSKGVLRFIQLLCEGHHLQLQNYVRDQPAAAFSVNIVNDIMRFLKEVCIACARANLEHAKNVVRRPTHRMRVGRLYPESQFEIQCWICQHSSCFLVTSVRRRTCSKCALNAFDVSVKFARTLVAVLLLCCAQTCAILLGWSLRIVPFPVA